jgi:small subunit ribosomal protein S7|tara:strand:- start:550 stop:1344 length:795 start_codon:yes stop_codon:yes gene_type:complete
MLPRVRLVARAVHGPHRGALLRGWAVQPAQLASLPRRELFLGASSLQRYLQQLQLDGSCRRLSAATTAAQGIDDAQAEVEEDPESSVDGPSPFALFDSPELSRFVNMLMQEGKKQTARTILWKAFGRLRRGGHDPREVFDKAIENATPLMAVRTVKSRGNQQVPFPLTPRRAEGLAMKWIVNAARGRKAGATMDEKLYQELMQASDGKGAAVGRKEAIHQLALANQAQAHFRWHASAEPGQVDMNRKSLHPQGRRAIRRWQGSF